MSLARMVHFNMNHVNTVTETVAMCKQKKTKKKTEWRSEREDEPLQTLVEVNKS